MMETPTPDEGLTTMCGLQSALTETAIVDKPADEDEHAGHHHGHAH